MLWKVFWLSQTAPQRCFQIKTEKKNKSKYETKREKSTDYNWTEKILKGQRLQIITF